MVQVVAYVRSLGRIPTAALPGDASRGRALFEGKGACAACHIVRGVGGSFGPELTDVGSRRGAAHLRESLLDPAADQPERAVPYEPASYPAYLMVDAVLRDGRTISGYRVNEDPFTIQLRGSEGELRSLRKAELARIEKRPGQSPMPSYRGVLSPAEIDDLVAWLSSLRGEP
jgi:putative heme-binding domain-containing protein